MTDPAEAAKFSEMKSIQLYSTKDEYIYAMKEDLSEWFNAMYSVQLTALNFIDKLENGVVICQHANNVTKAALNTLKFDENDLARAGVINIPTCAIQARSSINRLLVTPSGKSNWSGDYLLFKSDARAQSFQSRDNISNFIKWCRHIAKVRECLMFETDDLILRKNEKNFILCLLEVARFGSKFGIQVPTIIQLEQEIEAEIQREIQRQIERQIECQIERQIEQSKSIEPVLTKATSVDQAEQMITKDLNNVSNNISNNISNKAGDHNFTNDRSSSIQSVHLKEKTNSKVNLDDSSLDGSFGVDDELSANESGKDMFNDSLEENVDLIGKQNEQNELESCQSVNSEAEQASPLASFCSSTSLSSNSSILQQNENFQNICTHALANQAVLDAQKTAFNLKKNKVARNLAPLFRNEPQHKQNSKNEPVANWAKNKNCSNKSMNKESMDKILFETIQKMNCQHDSLSHSNGNRELNLGASQTNLHNHVCSIADRCTCEKQFPVIKIGEGKYRIGNTKNIVFIRILRNHIMVRVGGGWDTLENYLNKHDPCRCSGDPNHSNMGFKSRQSDNIYLNEPSNCSSNIVLTPVQNSSINQTNSINKAQSSVCHNTVQKSQAKANFLSKKSCASTNCSTSKKELDFTDAKLVVERNTQGKHVVGKIIINQTNEPSNSSTLNKSLSNSSLNNYCLTNLKVLNDSANIDMNGQHNQLLDKNNSFNVYNVNGCRSMAKSSIPTSNSLNSINHNVSKNRMKIFFNQMPPRSPKNVHPKHKNVLCEHQSTIVKMSSNELSSNPTTTGYNSLNDDSSSDFLEQTPIYTDNRIKSRIVKRYDKKRANTEVIIDLEQIDQSAVQKSNVDTNIAKAANASLKITSSPKPPPRNKKKYRKSKTTDVVAQFDVGIKNSAYAETSLNHQEDSLEESDYESSEWAESKKKAEKLNDSLESINLTVHNDIKVEEDSLLFNNDHGISLSLSTTSSISNINEIELDHEQDILLLSQKNARAQWDKTAQKLEFKTQLTSPNSLFMDQHCHSSPSGDTKHQKPMDQTNKKECNKANNLNSVKEQLYQMKKTIDAKINLKRFESGKTLSPAIRTTPRKVKKRSGERSITTGIFKEADHAKKTPPHQSNPTMIPKLSAKINQTAISKQTSSSLHNLNNSLNSDNCRRTRRDSSVSSNHTCLSNTNLSFSSPNTTPREFKENKAYELRKKSTLLNKIVTKNHQHDPIYSRSHPISAQMTQQQSLNATLNDHMQNVTMETTPSARKRLFAKKSEKQFDPNLSIGSNGSSSFSSNSMPVATNFILRNKILASSPIVNKLKVASPSTNVNRKKCSPIKAKPPPRSRSNNDLFYELERTNSAQDLIELINNCEPPVGDLTKFRVLLSECENCDPKIKSSKKSNVRKAVKLSMNKQKVPNQKLNCLIDQNEKSDSSSMSKSQHKRSRSLPSYECVASGQQQDFDAAYDEEYHEETYWQDVKTNF